MQKLMSYLKPRLSNYGFWLSLVALIPLVCNAFGITVIPYYEGIVNVVLSVVVVLGVANNPTTTGKWYSDDEKEMVEIMEDIIHKDEIK